MQKLAEGRALVAEAVEEDLRRIAEARASIDAALESQLDRLHAGRENLARALSEDLDKLDQTRSNIDADGRPAMSASWPRAAVSLRARWKPISPSSPRAASGIDGLVAGQVEKLAEGRDILTRALEADLAKLAESRSSIDGLVTARSRNSPRAATCSPARWKPT